jgi:hypothetical protein
MRLASQPRGEPRRNAGQPNLEQALENAPAFQTVPAQQ